MKTSFDTGGGVSSRDLAVTSGGSSSFTGYPTWRSQDLTAYLKIKMRMPRLLMIPSRFCHTCAMAFLYLVAGCVGDRSEIPAPFAEAQWRLSDSPLLTIGGSDKEDGHALYIVIAATVLSDGQIVIANSGTEELRSFDQRGQLLWISGRKGAGPGEFRSLTSMVQVRGDSLLVLDHVSRKFTLLDNTGRLGRILDVPAVAGRRVYQIYPVNADKIMLQADQRMTPLPAIGLSRDSLMIGYYDLNSEAVEIIDSIPTHEIYVEEVNAPGGGPGIRRLRLPFARHAYLAGGGGRAHAGMTDSAQVIYYDSVGAKGKIDLARPPLLVTPGHRDAYKAYALSRITAFTEKSRAEELLSRSPYPDVLPYFGGLEIDYSNGNIWVRNYSVPWESEEPNAKWSVYAPDGRMLSTITVPSRLDILFIGYSKLVASIRKQDDVEVVEVYAIIS